MVTSYTTLYTSHVLGSFSLFFFETWFFFFVYTPRVRAENQTKIIVPPMFLLYFIYTNKSNLSIRTWQKEHVPSPFLKIPVLASELLLSTWLFPSRAKLPLVNYITHLYEEAESTWNTWLVGAHAKKSHLCTKQFRRTYSWASVRKRKVMYIMCIARARPPWP